MSDDPPFLPIGTLVSSKFKGAFCESTVLNIDKKLKVKVNLKETPFGSMTVTDVELPNANFKVGEFTDINLGKKMVRCQIAHVKDQSKYHVEFNDGDERWLRRTQLVTQGGRHFAADGNLDAMPLTNPEAFSAPVKRRRDNDQPSTSRQDEEENPEDEEEIEEEAPPPRGKEKRRAAENAMSAIGDLKGVINDTQSEDSSDEKPNRGKRKRRESTEDEEVEEEVEEEKEEKEEEEEEEEEDEKMNGSVAGPSDANGLSPVEKLTRKDKKRLERLADRELKLKQKEEDKEEKAKKKEEEKDRKKEEKVAAAERKRLEKIYRKAIEAKCKRHEQCLRQILARKSLRYTLSRRNKRKVTRRVWLVAPRPAPPANSIPAREFSLETEHMTAEERKQRILIRAEEEGKNRMDQMESSSESDFSSIESKENSVSPQPRTPGKSPSPHPEDPPSPAPFEDVIRRMKPKPLVRRQRYRIRNKQLYAKWRRISKRFKTTVTCSLFRQWRRLVVEDVKNMLRNIKLLRNKKRKRTIRGWFRGVEQQKYAQMVIVHEDYKQARRLLRAVEKDEPDPMNYDLRCELDFEDIASPWLFNHFRDQEWYPAMLFSEVFRDEHGTVQRVVRNMGTGELLRVWEDDIVPFYWLPDFTWDEQQQIVKSRPADRQYKFRLAWHFSTDYMMETPGIHIKSLTAMLRCRRRDIIPTPNPAVAATFTTVPSPADDPNDALSDYEDEEEQEASGSGASDYDSDNSIKNASKKTKEEFVVGLVHYHLNFGNEVNTTRSIQGQEVDLYYMYKLAMKIGQPRKVNTMAPWTEWGRKLVPNAVEPEEELKEIFTECLSPLITWQSKMNTGLDTLQPRTERRQVLPGQYSENRKKRDSAMVQPVQTPKPVKRKRKGQSPSESVAGRKSRTNTLSPAPSYDPDQPGPSNATYSDEEEPKEEEPPARKRKKSRTPASRRSMSHKEEPEVAVAPKKGRPRKSTVAEAKVKVERASDEPEYVRANVLSHIKHTDPIRALFKSQWYSAMAVEAPKDFTKELMEIMMRIQRDGSRQIPDSIIDEINDIWKEMRLKAHYTGWNSRYDELKDLEDVMVTAVDQEEARRRFRSLGKELKARTVAMVERQFCRDDRKNQIDFLQLAQEALGDEEEVESEDSDREEEEEEKSVKSENREESDEENVDVEAEIKNNRRYSEDSPELGERSPTPSSKSSTSVVTPPQAPSEKSPESQKRSDESLKTNSVSPELGDSSNSSTSVKSPESAQAPEDLGSPELGEVTPSPEAIPEEPKAEEPIVEEAPLIIDSDDEEPEYPMVPKSPNLLEASQPPVLQPPVDHSSSAGSSNYPILSRQGSSNNSSLFSTTNLAHSGPLTLDEVPIVAPAAVLEDTNKRRRRVSSGAEDPSPTKRARRVSERSTLSPKRVPPLTSQFSSGALTLEMSTEASGPIDPTMVTIQRRRKTGTHDFQPSPTLNSSGPLTLHSPLGPPPVSPALKVRPPGAPPLGRPKKNSGPVQAKRVEERVQEPVEIPIPVADPSTESKESEGTSEEGSTPPEEREETASPRGGIAGRGGKRKRGGRVGGFAAKPTPKPVVNNKKSLPEEPTEEKEQEEPVATPLLLPATPSRPDSFANQKARMAKQMEEMGISRDYKRIEHLIDHLKVLREAPPEDMNMNLEELSNEARDIFYSGKSDLLALDKAFRKSEAARKKIAEAALAPPVNNTASPSDQPSTSSNPSSSSSMV